MRVASNEGENTAQANPTATRAPFARRPWISTALCAAGLAGVSLALGYDLALDGQAGYGTAQLLLLLSGLATLAIGLGFNADAGPRDFMGWLENLRERLRGLPAFAVILAQLTLLVFLFRQFQIESPAFYNDIALLAVAGFAVHYFLPLPHRLAFFTLLSLSGIWIVFGFPGAIWLVGIGLVLIAICHLPVPFAARIALLLCVTAALAALRSEWFRPLVPGAIWPILGSMFMFRLIAYMYDLRHSAEPVNWKRTLAYFFLLPNVVFPLFPVVDWSTFRRNYYDQDEHTIYQRGAQWMFRGLTHLLVYRLVYHYLTIAPEEIAAPLDLARYLVTPFLLYLRISGQFHLIVGMLHLFGFRLPETNHRFYLASNFTDVWRRTNIYWKDFMMKVVYYPVHFRLKDRGMTTRIAIATIAVFAVTWFLHAYQWFWLLGTFLLSWPDVLFWSCLALLLLLNSLYELRQGRRRSIRPPRLTLAVAAPRALSTVATFATMCVLWSLWSSASVGDWLALWAVVGDARPTAMAIGPTGGVAALGLVLVVGRLTSTAVDRLAERRGAAANADPLRLLPESSPENEL